MSIKENSQKWLKKWEHRKADPEFPRIGEVYSIVSGLLQEVERLEESEQTCIDRIIDQEQKIAWFEPELERLEKEINQLTNRAAS